ncbi:MAG: hypothetical protein EOP87_02110 [Verrucomicrobiaceae bacterium]|nr:MAG: hypothetical protein EOP87_02110 [Verrucomicrobiaceae bacterium]
MNPAFPGAGLFLFALPVLIAQWIGVVHLAKSGRSGEWWCMLSGTIMTTLGPILQIAALSLSWMGTNDSMAFFTAIMITGAISTLGSLLFMIGFAIHAVRLSRMRGRISELEMMNLAQAAELERIRNR